jgi:hypothetical protein
VSIDLFSVITAQHTHISNQDCTPSKRNNENVESIHLKYTIDHVVACEIDD